MDRSLRAAGMTQAYLRLMTGESNGKYSHGKAATWWHERKKARGRKLDAATHCCAAVMHGPAARWIAAVAQGAAPK